MELVDSTGHFDKAVLDEILSFRVVANNGEGQPDHRLVLSQKQGFQRGLVTLGLG